MLSGEVPRDFKTIETVYKFLRPKKKKSNFLVVSNVDGTHEVIFLPPTSSLGAHPLNRYNQLFNQPTGVSSSGFSYGLNIGMFKDISMNKKGSWAFAFGVGYSLDVFNQGLQVTTLNDVDQFSIDNILDQNTMNLQFIEFPIELRWRNSNAQKYKFWRIYPGFKFSYNLSNKFNSVSNGTKLSASNINSFQNLHYGLTLSVGYDAFNFHIYYQLNPAFKGGILNGESIDTRILKMGLIIYIL